MATKAATAEAEAPAPKARKAKAEKPAQPERVGMTTKEAAAKLNITPVKLRRILRTDDFVNDHTYTRYDITDAVFAQLEKAVAAGATGEKKPRGRKAKEAQVEDQAEEVAEELAELEEEEEVAELELDEDEDE